MPPSKTVQKRNIRRPDMANPFDKRRYFKALQDGPASAVVPIDKLSILVTVLFARLVFNERLTLRSATGLALFLLGTLLMLK